MFKKKYISLILLWSLGVLMLIYVSIPLITKTKSRDSAAKNLRNLSESETTIIPSDAYVMVTIDRKHFLTRFASYIPVEASVLTVSTYSGKPVERVLTKIKTVRRTLKTEDFTIKPAPLE